MNKKEIINKVGKYLEKNFKNESSGHDYYHSLRVRKIAEKIAKKEGGDLFVIELGALLHDIADWKFYGGTNEIGIKKAKILLKDLGTDEDTINRVCYIIDNISFKGAGVRNRMKTIEGKIVQDADRLDALGAIGIARTFTTGASRGRILYNPEISIKKEVLDFSKIDSYSSIHHFYDKVLKLKSLINTDTGKKIAKERHKFVELFLKEFFAEWKGTK